MEINSISQKSNTSKDNDIKLYLVLDLIKQDLYQFTKDTTKKGYSFNIKLNEKSKKIKLFITLTNNSDTNNRNDDIDFLIEIEEDYPKKAPLIFCLTIVYQYIIILYLVFRYCRYIRFPKYTK